MSANEATARLKINKLLEGAGWRLLDAPGLPANVRVEARATRTPLQLSDLGDDFERAPSGSIDYLLLNDRGFPLVVLEAKRESIEPLAGKEQARAYAHTQNCRFVILSNGNLHYFWDLERGTPTQIVEFPSPESITGYARVIPNRQRLIDEPVGDDFIALTQMPTYATDASYTNESERQAFIDKNKLRFLRDYQLRAVHSIQNAVRAGKDRFLFVMATGTGKTLISAAVIKLFLRTGNASRVLFLVDRIELEDQAQKNFVDYLKSDYTSVIYKEKRDEWRKAEIVVTTVQSLLFNNKYRDLFRPTDFDLVISDEAHRSIGGNARSVFEYFVGYKLGLTATPKDYLKHFEPVAGQSDGERERRLYLDTYRTFGCDDGVPTFSYGLEDGANEGHLIRPTIIDARTDVTAKLLAEQGLTLKVRDDAGVEQEATFEQKQFEKRFFSKRTNAVFCKTLLEHGLRDPATTEFGKTIVFAVSQAHASKLTNILNRMAEQIWPGKYNSDFAVQVTSNVPEAQQYTKNFANNSLMGSANFNPYYKTSKARVCVTVGMMTTGYDCQDILNLALMRPIFSPTDFVQIKGRGTRRHDFRKDAHHDDLRTWMTNPMKTQYLLLDFFANCEYFEKEFKYDEVLELPKSGGESDVEADPQPPGPNAPGTVDYGGDDFIESLTQRTYPSGMKVDAMFFRRSIEALREDQTLAQAIEAGDWERAIDYVNRERFNKPDEYITLEKLRRASGVDRRVHIREMLEYIFGLIPRLKSKDELLEEAFDTFVAQSAAQHGPIEAVNVPVVKQYFKAYATSKQLQHIIDTQDFTQLHTNAGFGFGEFKAVPSAYRTAVPEYIKDYINTQQFA